MSESGDSPTSQLGFAALWTGITAILLALIPVVGALLGIVSGLIATALGFIAFYRSSEGNQAIAAGFGLGLGFLSFPLSIGMTVVYFVFADHSVG